MVVGLFGWVDYGGGRKETEGNGRCWERGDR